MSINEPAPQVCLLRKTIQIPTGHGTGQLVKGELVTIQSSQGDDCTISLLMDASQVYSCHEKNLKMVPYDIVKFLLPVIPCSKRYDAFIKLDPELLTLPIGCHVNVNRGRPNTAVIGELRYRGEIKDRLGVWFGLKLMGIGSGYGDSDGSVGGVYYIEQTTPNSVLFTTIDELAMSKGTDPVHDSTVSLLSNMGDVKDNKSLNKICAKTLPARARRVEPKTNQCTYNEGDEVIVLKNKLPAEAGVVRTVFQDAKKRWMLGIELENPVGDSNGIYKGRQLFNCQQKFGIFCETSEAIPKHYYEPPNKGSTSQSSSPKSSNHSRSSSHGANSLYTTPQFSSPPSYASPPPSYNDSFNNSYSSHSGVNRTSPVKSPKANRATNKAPKTDFDKAFNRMRSPTPNSSSSMNNKLPPDLVNSMHTMSLVPLEDAVDRNWAANSVENHNKHRVSDIYKTQNHAVQDVYKPRSSPDTSRRSGAPYDMDVDRVDLPIKIENTAKPVSGERVDLQSDIFSRDCNRTSPKHSPETPEPPPEIDPSLEVGSMVQVRKGAMFHYGVIRWIGNLPNKNHVCAGLELEEETSHPSSNGMLDGVRYFTCPPYRALFCYLHDCSKDSRFDELPVQEIKQYFGPHESRIIEGKVEPPDELAPQYIGRGRGIQGNRNSCYLDATLYAMFAFNSTMDHLLSRPVEGDLKGSIQQRLRESVVNPLREEGFVGAEHMGVLRDLLSRCSSLEGLRDEEKEPEEFLNVLFSEIFNIKPLLSFRDGTTNEISHVNLCQILLERDPLSATMPNTQDLLTRYFVSQNLFFHTQPDLLLLQVPRSGKDFKVYDTVLTSTDLQLGGLCGGVWGSCFICNKTPFLKCAQCYLNQEFKCKYGAVPFCEPCCKLVHSHPSRARHRTENATNPTRSIRMVLSAVLCIHTSHYVTYCRVPTPSPPTRDLDLGTLASSSSGSNIATQTAASGTSWVFFDSMADREGGLGGYNIPQVEECPELETWLANPAKLLHDRDKAPEYVKRLISDALLCFYVRDNS